MGFSIIIIKNLFKMKNIARLIVLVSLAVCILYILKYMIISTIDIGSFTSWVSCLVTWFVIYVHEKSSEKVNDSVGNTEK